MKSAAELEHLADIASEGYLKANTPLNDSIVKLAQDQNLNREQINRVVETANTNVYLKLFNESNNKYVEFPAADSEKIASVLNPPKDRTVNYADYQHEPAKDLLPETPLFPIEGKQAELTDMEVMKSFYKIAGMQERINNAITEVDSCFEEEFDKFAGLVKQAVLRGTPFNEIQSAVETFLNDTFIKSAMKAVHTKLAEDKVLREESKRIEKTSSVNTDHPIIKKAEELLQFKNAFLTLNEKSKQNVEQLELLKQASVGSLVESVFQHPVVFGTGAVAGGVAGILGYKKIKDIRERQMNSPLSTVPEQYKRNG